MHAWIDLVIVALLPLTALLTVMQKRPYFALVSRGIMGAVAVLFYAILGAPDVALTEALVGTLLTVLLYAVAVRSSMVVRVGVLSSGTDIQCDSILPGFCAQHDLSLRQMPFDHEAVLMQALQMGQVDMVQGKAHIMQGFVPALDTCAEDEVVTVIARHGRWHERELRKHCPEETKIIRLGAKKGGGI